MHNQPVKSPLSKRIRKIIGPGKIPVILYYGVEVGNLARGFFKRYPLRSKRERLTCDPFFIIGSGRSGNTLMRAILTCHPCISIPPESYVLGRAIWRYKFYSFLPWNLLARLVISEFESWNQFYLWELNLTGFYQQAFNYKKDQRSLARLLDDLYAYYARIKKPGATRWGDKTPQNTFSLDLIDKVFPSARYIHMIRDGRDVVASYLAVGRFSNAQEAARRWLRSVDAGRKFGGQVGPGRYMEVTYENLVQDPDATVRVVCSFLGIDYHEEMLHFQEGIGSLGDARLPRHVNLSQPINVNSIGKWHRDLSQSDRELVERMLASRLVELNYPLE